MLIATKLYLKKFKNKPIKRVEFKTEIKYALINFY